MHRDTSGREDENVVVVKEAIHPYRWLAVSACFLIIGIGFVLTVRQLRHTDNEIQQSRRESCVQTYGAFVDVFLPFFPSPEKRTPKQNRDLQTLQSKVKELQTHCSTQTGVKN